MKKVICSLVLLMVVLTVRSQHQMFSYVYGDVAINVPIKGTAKEFIESLGKDIPLSLDLQNSTTEAIFLDIDETEFLSIGITPKSKTVFGPGLIQFKQKHQMML